MAIWESGLVIIYKNPPMPRARQDKTKFIFFLFIINHDTIIVTNMTIVKVLRENYAYIKKYLGGLVIDKLRSFLGNLEKARSYDLCAYQ